MHSRKTGSTIASYIAHFLSEINKVEVAQKWQFYSEIPLPLLTVAICWSHPTQWPTQRYDFKVI